MPNWCANVLSSVDKDVNLTEKLSTLLDDDGNIDFQKIVPCPEEYLQDDRWYNWRIANWGTKWSSVDCNFADDGKTVCFSTAWGPPLEIVKALSILTGANLRLLYSESGMGFHGEYEAGKDGGEVNNCYTFNDKIPTKLKEELIDLFGPIDCGDIEYEVQSTEVQGV